jgi:hypothetical protein
MTTKESSTPLVEGLEKALEELWRMLDGDDFGSRAGKSYTSARRIAATCRMAGSWSR